MTKPSTKKDEQRMAVHIFSNKGKQSVKEPSRIDIERRAYEIYIMRGGSDGHAVEDWLQAEHELQHGQAL